MRWQKLGHIFNPAEHALAHNGFVFAQSPQTLLFDDFIRIYFSTRSLDPINGKYLSHVSFVEMTKDLRTVLRVAQHTVIPRGELGAFDEHGIFPINVVRHKEQLFAYTCGWSRRIAVSVETAIGLAMSDDNGETFQRYGQGPILSASLHEPCLVGDAFVKVIDEIFHMWYMFGIGWKADPQTQNPERIYKIAHATSHDGIHWQKEEAQQIIPDRLASDESQALPSCVRIGSRYHLFFCYRDSFNFREKKECAYRIGHAYSEDLRVWTRDDTTPLLEGTPGAWDSDMQCYPHVFECDGSVFLLYNGNEFGRYGFGAARLVQ